MDHLDAISCGTKKKTTLNLCYTHVIFYKRSTWWIRTQKQIPTNVLLCKAKIFQNLQVTWCLIDALLFKGSRREKKGRLSDKKKKCLTKALLKHFNFHQNTNIDLIDGVMLIQCWQDQNETQKVEWDLLQALSWFTKTGIYFVFLLSVHDLLLACAGNRNC